MIPANCTDKEYLKYYASSDTKDNILERFEKLVDTVDDLEAYEKKLDKYYESSLEQSSFRRDVLEMINKLCEDKQKYARFKETKELAHEIVLIIENSYVEL